MKFVTLIGSWYVNTDQYALLGYDELLERQYKINAARIDYIEKDECDGEPTYYIIKLSDGSCIVTIDTAFLNNLK
jgi:hypothetical protein